MINLPTREQFRELIDHCRCNWNEDKKGYDIIGPNGNSIFLPALGFKWNKQKKVRYEGSRGYYWSSGSSSSFGYCLAFNSGNLNIDLSGKSFNFFPVRLVQEPPSRTSSQFIDLALPSGTLWAKSNATKEYLNWRQAQEFVKKLNQIVRSMQALKNNT